MTPAFYRREGDALILKVRVQPGAKQNAVLGVADGALRLKLAAPAVEGRANEALCAYLAELLGTAKTRVEIIKGQGARLKQVKVLGARHSPDELFPPGKTAP